MHDLMRKMMFAVRGEGVRPQTTGRNPRLQYAETRMSGNGETLRGSWISGEWFIAIFFSQTGQIHRMEATDGQKSSALSQILLVSIENNLQIEHVKRMISTAYNTFYFAGNRGRSSAIRGGFFKIRCSARRTGRLLVTGRRGKSDHASEFIFSSTARRSELRRELRWNLSLQVWLKYI